MNGEEVTPEEMEKENHWKPMCYLGIDFYDGQLKMYST